MVFSGSTNSVLSPGGDGCGVLLVKTDGSVRVSGRLGDNRSFSQAAYLSKNGQWPFYQSLYSKQGMIWGWLAFTNRPASSIEGGVHWFSPVSGAKYYPAGFSVLSQAFGSTYTPPLIYQRVLDLSNNCSLTITGGNLLSSQVNAAILTQTNYVLGLDGGVLLRLAVPASGSMKGRFIHPTINAKRSFFGVVLQQENTARGFFLGTNQSGAFLLQGN